MSIGSANLSIVCAREIYGAAMEKNAVNLILLHNHPSGDPTPSQADIAATDQLIEGGELLEIHLLDHIIIGNGVYYSMKEQGII